ncbi:hypothetical protein ABT116_49410, partial [Streptomyces sp. NPDC002130]|uniref:hypothetical protein n=1 Tax=Streptomyces sp. NPDC002130 TaxID=3155568 RepID=UPI003324D417
GGVRVCLPQNVYENDLNPHLTAPGKLLFPKGRLHHSGDEELAISHETIYRSIYTTRWDVIPQ